MLVDLIVARANATMLPETPFAGSLLFILPKLKHVKPDSIYWRMILGKTRFRLRYWGGLVGLTHLHA